MYIKRDTCVSAIPEDLKQTFHHEFTNSVSRDVIIRLRHEERITDRDFEIVDFLYRFHFATAEQLLQFLNDEELTLGALQSRMDKLVHNRILNKFLLSPIREDRIYPEALTIYCLDLGGKYLLTNFSTHDTNDWRCAENYKSSEIISKELTTVDIFLQLHRQTQGKLEFFETAHLFQANGQNLYPSFYFGIKSGGVRHYFLGDVIRPEELPLIYRKKAEKLDSLLSTNAWRKYFFDKEQPPVLLLLCPDDILAKEVGQLLENGTSIERVFMTTQERIEMGLYETGGLLKYLSEEDKLKEGRISLFHPDNLD